MAIIAGVDEAGRGPLAGPVCAAAVILPAGHQIGGLADSKKLTPRKRDLLYIEIMDQAHAVGIGWADHEEIDRINILQATYMAMQRALGSLKIRPEKALIDGYGLPTQIISNEGIIGGDRKVDCIKAASIIAKVSRDRHMGLMDNIFPEYGFTKHKGYGTKQHLEVLDRLKATPIHRRSFSPVAGQLPTIKWLRNNQRIGWWGERLAALKLVEPGVMEISTNIKCGSHGELDLIIEDQTNLVFVEVKTITKEQLGTPEQKIDRQKMEKLQNAIDYYIQNNDIEKDIRLDAMTVVLGRGRPIIRHYRGISLS